MKLISWNVNGLRAVVNKGFKKFFEQVQADIFCIQETKMQVDQLDMIIEAIFEGYYQYWNSAEKKGYSGTAIFTKKEPLSVKYGLGIEEHDKEGRLITLEYENFYLVNCYTPNSKRGLERLPYRMLWEDEIRKYLIALDKVKPVIYCGDLNVAHKEIDVKNDKANIGNSGFTYEERDKMTQLLESNFVDTFRYKYPDKDDSYTWWSYMGKAREKNVGWRIDYFITSDNIKKNIIDAKIHNDILGSDHCPIELDIDLKF